MKFMDGLKQLFKAKKEGPKVSRFERPPMQAEIPTMPETRFRTATKAKRIPNVIKKRRLRERRMHRMAACRATY